MKNFIEILIATFLTLEFITLISSGPLLDDSIAFQMIGNGNVTGIYIPSHILQDLKKLVTKRKYNSSKNSTRKRTKAKEEEEELDQEAVDDILTEDVKLGLVPNPILQEEDGIMDRIRKVVPPVMNILKGSLALNETALRDLWILLAYEAAYLFP